MRKLLEQKHNKEEATKHVNKLDQMEHPQGDRQLLI